jgi:hypothetical protein
MERGARNHEGRDKKERGRVDRAHRGQDGPRDRAARRRQEARRPSVGSCRSAGRSTAARSSPQRSAEFSARGRRLERRRLRTAGTGARCRPARSGA